MSPWIELATLLQQQIPNSHITTHINHPTPHTTLDITKNNKKTRYTKPYITITLYPDHILATSWNTIPHRQILDLNHPDSLTQLQTWLQQLGITITDFPDPTPAQTHT